MAELDIGLADADLPILRRYNFRSDPRKQGEIERRLLGIPVADQLAWRPEEAFRRWREAIEACGLYVYLDRFDLDDCRGFSLHDPGMPPGIVVNKKEEFIPARIFTLLHEYAHVLIGEPGISDENPRNAVESFCNRFAAAVLMPDDALLAVMPERPTQPVEWGRVEIQNWARRLGVSGQALSLRLEQARLAPAGFFDRFRAESDAAAEVGQKRRKKSGGDHVNTRISELGGRLLDRVIIGLDRRVLSAVDASRMLGLSPRHFGRVRAARLRRREAISGGR